MKALWYVFTFMVISRWQISPGLRLKLEGRGLSSLIDYCFRSPGKGWTWSFWYNLLSHLNSYVIFDDAGPLVPLSVGMCHTSSDWTMLVLPEDKVILSCSMRAWTGSSQLKDFCYNKCLFRGTMIASSRSGPYFLDLKHDVCKEKSQSARSI